MIQLNVNDRVCHVISHEWGGIREIDDVTGLAVVMWDYGEHAMIEPMDLNKTVEGGALCK